MNAADLAVRYHQAWTSGRLDDAWALLADDVVCHGPAGPMQGRGAVASFMGGFASTLTGATLLAAHGDASSAVVYYDTSTDAVRSAPAAELVTVSDGQITQIRIVFDRLPFALARGDVRPA